MKLLSSVNSSPQPHEETVLQAQSDYYWKSGEETYYEVCDGIALHGISVHLSMKFGIENAN